MTNRNRCLLLLLAMLVHAPVVAQVSTATEPPEDTRAAAKAAGRDARERGLTALQAGQHFAAAAAFRQAADLGDAEAMRHLADLTFSGKGVAQNYEQALHGYCRSALAGDLGAVDRLLDIELTSWSERRDAQGWEAACEQRLKPPPRPRQPRATPPTPQPKVEIIVNPRPEEYTPLAVWSGYAPWHWRWVNPRPKPRKPVPPRTPMHAPGLYHK